MARKSSYTKRELSVACSKLKSYITKMIVSGELEVKSITKTYVCNELGRRLKLSDGSSLLKSTYQYKEYLNSWYSGLIESLEPYASVDTTKAKKIDIDNSSVASNETADESSAESIKELKSLISHLNSVITTLRIENESLRLARMHRVKKLDASLEILDESIDDIELNKLYKAVNNLFKARFQK